MQILSLDIGVFIACCINKNTTLVFNTFQQFLDKIVLCKNNWCLFFHGYNAVK